MKRNLLLLLLLTAFTYVSAQPTLIVEAPLNNSSTSANRAPNGTSAHAYMRACFLVLQNELTQIASSTTLTTFGFTMASSLPGPAVAGNFTVYLQNTSDVSYNKGTTWSSLLTGMTQVYAGVMVLPISAGTTSITLTLSTPFVYSGGGLYVAYDWNCTGPYSTTSAVYLCESVIMPLPGSGGGSAASSSSAPGTLGLTNFRPAYLFGFNNPYTNDIITVGLEVPGRIASQFNTPHTVNALIKNSSSGSQSNIPVALNITGANPFTSTVTISSLAAGASTMITFPPLNPSNSGTNLIVVSVPGDQNNVNNSATYVQSVTCNEWAQNPAAGGFTHQAVGFNTGSGIIANLYPNPVTSTLTGIRIAISTPTSALNQQVYGALLSNAGVLMATTNTRTITSNMLGTFQTFTFATPQNLAASTSYFLGLAQTTGTMGYFPAGTQTVSYLPPNIYYSTALTGGLMTVVNQNFGYFGIEAIFGHTVTVTAASQSVVCGSTATLNAASSSNYSWSTGAQTQSITVSPTITTAYTVTATNTLGCMAAAVPSVIVSPMPVTLTASPSTLVCGNPSTLTASSAGTHSWSTGSQANFIVISPTATTVYTVTANNNAGCISKVPYTLAVTPIPVTAATTTTFVCKGGTVGLTAGGATTYSWNAGATPTAQSFTHSPVNSLTYVVVGTTTSGCVNSASIPVTVQSFTALNVNTLTVTVCLGNNITVTASGAVSYTWDTGSSFYNQAVLNHSPAATGIYSVTGANPQGCAMTRTVNVIVNHVPLVVSSNKAICAGKSTTLVANGATNYTWSPFDHSGTYEVTPAITTTYVVNATGATGCSTNAAITVSVNPNPTVSAGSDRDVMCRNELNVISATGASLYTWIGLGTGYSVDITSPNTTTVLTYTVVGTDQNKCTGSASVSVKVNACTGIDEISEAGFVVFPNPSAGRFTVRGGPGNSGTLMITYVTGAIVATAEWNGVECTFETSDLPRGVYYLLFTSGNTVRPAGSIVLSD
jgi:hypothetical protein